MQDLSGFTVPKGFRGGNGIKVQLWWAVQATLFAWSPQVLYRWRAVCAAVYPAISKPRTCVAAGSRLG